MSSRVLRKLQGETDLAAELGAGQEDDSDPETTGDLLATGAAGGAKRKQQLNVNRYDLLNQQSLSESEVKEDDDNETEPTQDQEGGGGGDGTKNAAARRKKKTKKKKKSTKAAANQRSSEDNMESEDIDEVTRILREMGPGNEAASSPKAQEVARNKALLSIENRNLNPSNELKRVFGVKIVQSEQRKKTRHRSQLRPVGLVTPKENWPHIGKQGISMRYVAQQGTVQKFTYEHSPGYQAIQRSFLAAVESLNPDNIVAVINAHPYHVDALLQLSELCRMSEDLPMAADLVERALYALEFAFHPLFSLAQGNCRLDYRKQENRSLYITLFKHLSFVGQRACHRTALELCKVLLSLSPEEDPLAVVLVVDLYALRSRQFAWLLQLAQEWETSRNLSQLPNFAFSAAVARFHLAQQAAAQATQAAELMEQADEALQQALIMFPGVLMPLLDKCSVQPDAQVQGHHFFGAKALTSMSPALMQLVMLYVARIWPVWKEPELLPWLERNTHAVLRRVDEGEPLVIECDGHRRRRYQGVPPRNITRHVLLADVKDVPGAIVHEEDSQGSVMSFDPLPPLDSENLYERPQRSRAAGAVGSSGGALSMFFRSLLPTFHLHDQPGDHGAGALEDAVVEAEGAAGGPEVRHSLASLMDILRELLRNVQLPEAPERGDADVDSSGEEEFDFEPGL